MARRYGKEEERRYEVEEKEVCFNLIQGGYFLGKRDPFSSRKQSHLRVMIKKKSRRTLLKPFFYHTNLGRRQTN